MDIRSFERLIEKKDGGKTPSTVILTKELGLSRFEALMCNKLGNSPWGKALKRYLFTWG